jgi:UMF1 family MFS transporter
MIVHRRNVCVNIQFVDFPANTTKIDTFTGMTLNDKRVINGWAFLDWANSAYYLVISTAIFPIYYLANTETNVPFLGGTIENTSLHSFSVTAAYLVLALISPLLSGIADYAGRRMFFLRMFTMLGALGCIALFLFQNQATIWIGLIAFMLGTIGAAGGLVFYDSYLPMIASEDQYDKVSARGYAYGYVGSILLLIVCLVLINQSALFGIDAGLASRISFVMVGVWWLIFSQITFRRLPKDNRIRMQDNLLTRGWHELMQVWKIIKADKSVKTYLVAYFFFIAGVQTVIYLASSFATDVLNFESNELIITILLLQVIAAPGAILSAVLSKRKGNKYSLMIQLYVWLAICIGAYLTTEKWQFFLIAAFVGLVLGGIQSLSRSTYAKLLENRTEDLTSFFSFYDILTKISIASGTFLFGLVNAITGDMRNSVLVLAVFFVVGILLLRGVDKYRINTHMKTATG